MSTKFLTALYNDAHAAIAAKQHAKYGNPITEAPQHVPEVLARYVGAGHITALQGRKLAMAFGRKAYGEVGLTSGVVSGVLDRVLGFNALGWQVAMQLESQISAY